MSKTRHSICVFCGSSFGSDPVFAEAARETGRLLASHGYGMIFGGGGVGLMGEAARAARDGGAKVTGILPAFLRGQEPPLDSGEIVEIVPDMGVRKRRMLELSDGFLILPGGIGTLDEFFEVIVEKQLGQLHKPIVILNLKNCYDPLIRLLNHTAELEFVRPNLEQLFRVALSPDQAIAHLTRVLDSKPAPSRD
ncbi:MAG: TIGR00730 family Rossman fold protein [Proteobacteria bacterium]|nr:TIGR00730 family Rossman fold protein [Pseudomonadota bacterium]